jgi:hypothetical protein
MELLPSLRLSCYRRTIRKRIIETDLNVGNGREALLSLEKVFGRVQSAWTPAQGTELPEDVESVVRDNAASLRISDFGFEGSDQVQTSLIAIGSSVKGTGQ